MIKIITGYSNLGGSTVAFANLCNLFNANGLKCELYGPSDWVKKLLKTDCYKSITSLNLNKSDKVIYHFLNLGKLDVDKCILSCHETNLFEINKFGPPLSYDKIHFVSNFQKNWQNVDGIVIPNIISKYKKSPKKTNNMVAGIIGSIDEHKNVHVSIERAKQNPDVSKIELWGAITQPDYYQRQIVPLLDFDVSYNGYTEDMQMVYDRIDTVYSSSKRECLPMIQGECFYLNIPFNGLPENMRELNDYIFDDQIILSKWKELLEIF